MLRPFPSALAVHQIRPTQPWVRPANVLSRSALAPLEGRVSMPGPMPLPPCPHRVHLGAESSSRLADVRCHHIDDIRPLVDGRTHPGTRDSPCLAVRERARRRLHSDMQHGSVCPGAVTSLRALDHRQMP